MKIDFDERVQRDGSYYITEKEAKSLCKQSDPEGHHIPLLPKFGWERRVIYDEIWYWIGLRKVQNGKCWYLRELT